MLKILLIAGLVIVILFVVVAALQPNQFRVERSTRISAPASTAFDQIHDLHRWQKISPYVKLDPTATYTFDGPPAGVGASLSWMGNSALGQGRMTIVESQLEKLVRMRMDFFKPFESTCVADFVFAESKGQTTVTWSLSGPKNFISKAAGLIMNMDQFIGRQFEEGLANLKAVTENAETIRQSAVTAGELKVSSGR